MADLLTGAARPSIPVAARGQERRGGEVLAVTDETGAFIFCDLPWTGSVELEVMDPDGGSGLRSRVVVGPGHTWAGIRYMAATEPAGLRGTVTDASTGLPLSGADVEVRPLGLRTVTDERGAFELQGMAGAIAVHVSHPRAGAREHHTWLEGGFTFETVVALAEDASADLPPIILTRGDEPFEPAPDRPARLAGGGGGDSGPAHAFDWGALPLEPGERVRLTAPGVSIGDGTLRDEGGGVLTVVQDAQEWTVDRGTIQSLEVRKSSSLRLGAIVGGLGLGVGALLGAKYILETDRCSEPTSSGTVRCTRKPVGAMTFAPVGAAAGAAVGLVLGQLVMRWVPVF